MSEMESLYESALEGGKKNPTQVFLRLFILRELKPLQNSYEIEPRTLTYVKIGIVQQLIVAY